MDTLTNVVSQAIQSRCVNTVLYKIKNKLRLKAGLSSGLSFGGMKQGMIPVYTETLILKNDDEGFEQLANLINFRVSGGIFLQ